MTCFIPGNRLPAHGFGGTFQSAGTTMTGRWDRCKVPIATLPSKISRAADRRLSRVS